MSQRIVHKQWPQQINYLKVKQLLDIYYFRFSEVSSIYFLDPSCRLMYSHQIQFGRVEFYAKAKILKPENLWKNSQNNLREQHTLPSFKESQVGE